MSITIRKGNTKDTERFIRLLHEVKASMTDQAWFFLDPDDEIRDLMNSGKMQLWLAEEGERIAGAFDLIIPELDPCNYGYDLGFDDDRLLRVVQMDTAAVHPDYRGLGLQKMLMETAEKEIRKSPGRILLCTIHPDNRFSLQNVLKQNYTIEKKVEKYGSVRFVLRKDLP